MTALFSFGEWVKQRRSALLLSRDDLARAVGCAEVSLRKIEADERRPSLAIAERLAERLELTGDEQTLFLQVARGLASAERLPAPISRGAAAAPPPPPPATPPLPSGTVTFLFTDIEGSTRLWEQHPQAMPGALARHDAILRQTITAQGGHVFKTVGDAVCAVFASAPAAIVAALAGQRALQAEAWGATGPLRVRMALHTGTAELRDGDYAGYALSRVARLLAAGHGGQMLLSLATAELVRDHLHDAAYVRDIGTYRLKDIERPERIFQLIADDLPPAFPPLRAMNAQAGNLPARLTTLIGRASELADLGALLRRSNVRLLTLTGPGGTGKTRLGLQVAAELAGDYPDGAWFVDLAPITDLAQVAATIARDLGATVLADKTPQDVLVAFLREKQLLVVLDNFEQVIDAAPLVADLLRRLPGLTLLVTSRAALHLSGEHEYAVPPLALPPRQPRTTNHEPPLYHHILAVDELTQYDAVRLFIERAVAVKPGFAVTNANAPAVAEICQQLDGLPLAIELAAARSKLFAPEALLARLNQRLQFLVGGARDWPTRQQTIRSMIEWSYNLLDAAEQRLFARLGVFAGGFTLEAAEAVCGDPETARGEVPASLISVSVLDQLAALVDQSQVKQTEGVAGEPRFTLLETIREYALERLAERAEVENMRQCHALYFLALAEEAEPKLRSAEQMKWVETLDGEYDNLRAALEWSLVDGAKEADSSGQEIRWSPPPPASVSRQEVGLRLVGALWYYWLRRNLFAEWGRWAKLSEAVVEQILQDVGSAPASAVQPLASTIVACVKALISATLFTEWTSDYSRRRILTTRCITLARQSGNQYLLAAALVFAGQTIDDYREGLALARALGDHWMICEALGNLAMLSFGQGKGMEEVLALAGESLSMARTTGDRWRINRSLLVLGSCMYSVQHGDLSTARTLLEESLTGARTIGDQLITAHALFGFGVIAQMQGDYAVMQAYTEERLAIERKLEKREGIANALVFLGYRALTQSDYGDAHARLSEALILYRKHGEKEDIDWALRQRAITAFEQGVYDEADTDSAMALELSRQGSQDLGISWTLKIRGLLALAQGDLTAARALLQEALDLYPQPSRQIPGSFVFLTTIATALGQAVYRQGEYDTALPLLRRNLVLAYEQSDVLTRAEAAITLAHAELAAGDLDAAAAHLAEGLAIVGRIGARQRVAWALEGLAGVAAAQAQPMRAARLWGAAEALRAQIGAPIWPVDRPDYERRVAAARAQMPQMDFDAAWAAGRAQTWQQATAEALDTKHEDAA